MNTLNSNYFYLNANCNIYDGFKNYCENFNVYFYLEGQNIRINSYPVDNGLFLDNYQIIMALNNFHNLGKSFRQCDNINEVFASIKNLTSSNDNFRLELNNQNDNITLILSNRLLSGSLENMRITFYKYPKDYNLQFKLLRSEYLKLKWDQSFK